MEFDSPLVFVRCLTFNHEAYIEDALNGFVMQETNFPFVVTIVNDASPDNTRQVLDNYIKENCILENVEHANTDYADIITAIPTQNTNCLLYILNLHENHFRKKSHRPYYQHFVDKAKYWAECEGDDYWTDPLKLQKQVDFMEVHSEYSITGHRYKIYNQEEQKYELDYINYLFNDQNITGVEFERQNYLDHPFLQTMTVVYRTDCFDQLFHASLPVNGDLTIFYVCLLKGKGYCFNFEGAVYRRSNCGVYAKKSWDEKHFVGFNLYSKMYIYTKDSVFFPHAISHLNHVFADAKHSITEYKSTNRKYLKEVFDFLWEIGYIGEYIKKLLKLVYWKIKYTVIKNFRRK